MKNKTKNVILNRSEGSRFFGAKPAQNDESGRSMVEMLGVLAIIGILSIAGVAGYKTAMNKHKANELINEANKRATIVASQIAMQGKDANNASITEFKNPTGYTLGVAKKNDKQFNITIQGVHADVCKQINATVGNNTIIREIGPECTYFTYNNDMSTTVVVADCDANKIRNASGECVCDEDNHFISDGNGGCKCEDGLMVTADNRCIQCGDGFIFFEKKFCISSYDYDYLACNSADCCPPGTTFKELGKGTRTFSTCVNDDLTYTMPTTMRSCLKGSGDLRTRCPETAILASECNKNGLVLSFVGTKAYCTSSCLDESLAVRSGICQCKEFLSYCSFTPNSTGGTCECRV